MKGKFWEKHQKEIIVIGTILCTAVITYEASKKGIASMLDGFYMEVYIPELKDIRSTPL